MRLLLHRYVEKRERGCPRTSSCAISTSVNSTDWMVDAWKSLRMGFRCGEEHNLRSTQHWFAHCTGMALQEGAADRNGVAFDAAHRQKRANGAVLERRHCHSQSHSSCKGRAKAAWLRRWSAMLCWLAAQRGRSRCRCSTNVLSQVWEVIPLQCMRC